MKGRKTGKILLFLLVILALGILVYFESISYNFVFCDDNVYVLDNYKFNSDISNVFQSFKKTLGTTFYRPFLTISFIIDANVGGRDPGIYHATNLIVHLIGSLLVFFLLLKLGYSDMVSFLFSLFFLLHPILTPAVSWIPGRNDSLVAVFIFLSFISLISFLGSNKWYLYILHVIFFAISLFTKETALVFPVLCVLFIWLYRREKLISRRNLFLIISWIIIAGVWLLMRSSATAHIKNPDTIGFEAFVRNYPTVAAIIGKIFLPVKMIVLSSFESFSIASGVVFMIFLAVLVISLKNINKSKVFFGVLWFLLFILPPLMVRIVNVDDFFDYAEHRAYVPLFGVIVVIAEILSSLKIDFKKPAPIVIGSIILIIFAVRSYSYKNNFENRKTYWTHSVEASPNKSRGYFNLGKVYFLSNDLDKAESLYKQSVELNPNNPDVYTDLSAVYLRKGDFETAEKFAEEALSFNSQNPVANYYLGKSYEERNQVEKALQAFEKACKRNNKFPHWFFDLGNVYYRTEQFEKAITAYEKALKLNPNYSAAYSNTGSAFAALNRFDEAESSWIRAISLNPKMYDSYLNLIKYYDYTNQYDKVKKYVAAFERNGGRLPRDMQQKLQEKGILN